MKTGLRKIPGVGPNIEQDLINLGYTTIESLKGRNPEEMYMKDCLFKGFKEDKCQLYVYRLAVYFAENEIHDPEKLKWWNWKDKIQT
ncbi:MAG: Pathogenicity locus [Firmicutes bacterium]|nr:Pathogenicity locus [Bacillota bacterium]